jgi:hypothetical protein
LVDKRRGTKGTRLARVPGDPDRVPQRAVGFFVVVIVVLVVVVHEHDHENDHDHDYEDEDEDEEQRWYC